MGLPDEIENHYQDISTVKELKKASTKEVVHQLLQPENRRESPVAPDSQTEDFLLWSEFKRGKEAAFTQIYNQYIVSLYNYGEMVTPNKELTEDSVHDLFVDLWKNRKNIGHVSSIKYYLYKGLKRKIIKNLSLKRRLPFNTYSDSHDIELVFSHEFNIITKEGTEEQGKLILQAINSLSKRQKKAILLRFYDDLSFQEIGDLLDINTKSTYTLIYRALDVLKQNLLKTYVMLAFFCELFLSTIGDSRNIFENFMDLLR